jgi:hypothetical protein
MLQGYSAPGNPPTCAGLRPSRLLQPNLTTLRCWAGGFSPHVPRSALITDLAPGPRSVLAQASSVAPVVNTSSTSKTRKLSTWLPGRVAKAPRTDSQRSSKLSTCLSGRARVPISSTALCGNPSLLASGLESSTAWLYPRSRCRSRCRGTGTTTFAASAPPQRLNLLESQQQNRPHHCAFIPRKASRLLKNAYDRSCRPGRATPLPLWSPTQAKATRKSRKGCRARVRTMPGNPSKSGPGSHLSIAFRRCTIRREKTLTTASLISASNPRTLRRRTSALLDALPSAIPSRNLNLFLF